MCQCFTEGVIFSSAKYGSAMDNVCREALSLSCLTYCTKPKYDRNLENLHAMYLQAN